MNLTPCLCLAAVMSSALISAAEPAVKVEGFTHVRTLGGIDEYTLDSNGLQVLLLPQKGAPVVTFMVTYHVGSRNEVTGTTGATHLLEHLMFKGTEKHDRSKGTGFDQMLEQVGAETNATTWLDRTNYYATVPTGALPLIIDLEADRMRNLSLREEDRRPEMTVVRNEFERGENEPTEALSKELWAAAFEAHPYHHNTIGWRSDIERVPISKLRAFYDTFYWPNNATTTVIGDFDPSEALAEIKKNYGPIPKAPHDFPRLYTEEPPQTGQRRVTVKRGGEIGLVALAHKIPEGTHADWPALEVLSSILSSGKTSRFYRALTDKNLTIEATSSPEFHHDPSLHIIDAELAAGVKHEEVEKKIVAEIEKVKKSGVTAAEVQTAIAGLLARQAFHRDGSFAQASIINECIAAGDWTLYITLEDKLKAITPADVQRVAQKYLVENHSVAGWFVPTEGETEKEKDYTQGSQEKFEAKKVLAPKPLDPQPAPSPATDYAKRIHREQVTGLDVLVLPTGAKDIVHLKVSLPAGESLASNRALPHLTAGMLERGTKQHDQFVVADMLEKVGADLEFKVGNDVLDITAKCLRKDVPLLHSLVAEQLRTPAFSAAEFSKLKKQLISSEQESLEDPEDQATIAFSRAIFAKNHPARKLTVPEMVAAIEKTTLAEVKAFHTARYGPVGMHVVAVGDIDAETIKTALTASFGGWKPQAASGMATAATGAVENPACDVPMADKASISVIIGQPSGVRASDPEWLALNVGTGVLGQGFTSRLIGNVRDREGLTYSIGSAMGADTFRTGDWQVEASFAPTLLEQGLASTRREISGWREHGISAEELTYKKTAMTGQFAVALETTEGMTDNILRCVERGFDLKWLDEYPAKVNALTLEEVNAAIKHYIDPAKMVTVRAGTLPGQEKETKEK